MTERCRIAEACHLTGLPARTVQNLAAGGKIPGAAKLGGLWTFDRARLRGWIREQERACGGTSTKEAGRGGPAFDARAASYAAAYERALAPKRSAA